MAVIPRRIPLHYERYCEEYIIDTVDYERNVIGITFTYFERAVIVRNGNIWDPESRMQTYPVKIQIPLDGSILEGLAQELLGTAAMLKERQEGANGN